MVTRRGRFGYLALLSCAFVACSSDGGFAFDDDVLAAVESRGITETQLSVVHDQLGAFGQARFRGAEGQRALLSSLIDIELLHELALRDGYGDDPRVQWDVVEELAARQERAIVERRVPRATVEADEARLLQFVREHPDRFWVPEKRNIWFASFKNWDDAFTALDALRSGQKKPEDFEDFGITVMQVRDDDEFPFFHRFLFDPKLKAGDWLAVPVMSANHVMAARVESIEPGHPATLEDPVVRAQVIDAVLEAPRAEARLAYLAELRKRWPLEMASAK